MNTQYPEQLHARPTPQTTWSPCHRTHWNYNFYFNNVMWYLFKQLYWRH
jgi:hypothetical protein